MMRSGCLALLAAMLFSACQTGPRDGIARDAIRDEMKQALENRSRPAAPDVNRALLPPLSGDILTGQAKTAEARFDLSVNNAPAVQVFNAIVSGTKYSMLVNPEVAGTISVNLKNVTLLEAMDTLRELYGYEYRVTGSRIFVLPVALQSRVFQVNYPTTNRQGSSDTRVASGTLLSGGGSTGGSSSSGASAGTSGAASGSSGSGAPAVSNGSAVSTTSHTSFWDEIATAIRAIIGTAEGRSVVVSPQAGMIVVRAQPRELREVDSFLRASKLAVERQVMLEAKIVEVSLKEGFQSGINWSSFDGRGNQRWTVGGDPSRVNIPGSIGRQVGFESGSIVTDIDSSTTPPTVTMSTLAQIVASPAATGGSGLLGMSFVTNSFAALLSFLETQGSVSVLSSPRIATLNNQKAILRVGTDDFFVTNVTTTSTSTGSTTTSTPSITVQPFFSGISLDVTPQIDDDGNITLHVRPSVSVVTERNRVINLGNLGSITLPLASSNINETDTVVRVHDGNVVAIGGLMQQSQSDDLSKVPNAGDVPVLGNLFKQTGKTLQKRELVFLLKPTVIRDDKQWEDDLAKVRDRLERLQYEAPASASSRP